MRKAQSERAGLSWRGSRGQAGLRFILPFRYINLLPLPVGNRRFLSFQRKHLLENVVRPIVDIGRRGRIRRKLGWREFDLWFPLRLLGRFRCCRCCRCLFGLRRFKLDSRPGRRRCGLWSRRVGERSRDGGLRRRLLGRRLLRMRSFKGFVDNSPF
jgi:hypothetical protein